MAGGSAREVARVRRDKAERLLKQAEMFQRGAEGEEATAKALAALPAGEWTVFHDLHWPGRTYANIDHVVVGPPGIFVIDTKNWSGRIAVKGDVLRQNGYSREKNVAAAAESALAVARLVPLFDVRLVQPVLCFVRDEDTTGGWARDVAITTTGNLTRMLTSRKPALGPDELRAVAQILDLELRSATARPTAALAAVPAVARHSLRASRTIGARLVLTAAMLATLVGVPSIAHVAMQYAASR